MRRSVKPKRFQVHVTFDAFVVFVGPFVGGRKEHEGMVLASFLRWRWVEIPVVSEQNLSAAKRIAVVLEYLS